MTENHNKSSRLLFVPLNTNHVLIMNNIIKHLQIPYEVLSHDKISSSAKYHTENMLKKLNVPFRHFAYTIDRNENENFSLQIYHFFCIKKIIEKTLTDINPNKIVLAVDNDPISYIILKFSRNRNIQSFILQEASARPDANVSYPGFKGILIKLFSFLGIRLGYILHGTSHLYTEYFVSGNAAKNVMIDRGIPEKKLRITGQPKYDDIMIKAASLRHSNLESKQLLFAAGLDSIDTEAKIQFVKRLVQLSRIYGLLLLIKLHPRSNETPDKYRSILNDFSLSNCCIVKEGDDTFSLLEQSYALITVASHCCNRSINTK